MTTLAIPFSGGMDSYCAYLFAKNQRPHWDVKAVFVRYGQPYLAKEEAAVHTLLGAHDGGLRDLVTVDADLVTPKLGNVPTLKSQEIYGRNLLAIFYAGLIGDVVWLSSLETEMNPTAVRDKQPEFVHMMSTLMSYVMKSKRLDTRVETPFAKMTKTEVLEMILDIGPGGTTGDPLTTPELLTQTVSCYHPKHHNCGECSTCFKRWIAGVNVGLKEAYVSVPWANDYATTIIPAMQEAARKVMTIEERALTRFSLPRLMESSRALQKVGISIWPNT